MYVYLHMFIIIITIIIIIYLYIYIYTCTWKFRAITCGNKQATEQTLTDRVRIHMLTLQDG